MEVSDFWSLIDQSVAAAGKDCKSQAAFLSKALVERGEDDIVDFENHLNQYVGELSNFDVLAANFIVCSHTSDDEFEDFRAWLVTRGKKVFDTARDDVESIAGWLEREDVDDIDGGTFVTLASNAFEDAGGSEDDFYDQVEYPDEADFEMAWPDSKDGFEEKWPALVRKFWNQERINELHPD